ncbi:transglycosylase SLT domain-containing protein [Advenella mimigardefordensis]|uniref:Putative transglycosylase n=1 Tax=Advenella mimigardefordensis (strain DSM 17166 / LMG 22922 / DPN7) TaxID=1247726 RepID=W0P5S3_ADVMD|nr:transglycosylase SLT domain-containing protein [Advenella mimigardefordensis]AHG62189.1 putative transglycosylase [Advenella mimigardefordensis DPN7]
MTVTPQIGSWEGFYADRTERLNAATDPATRAHFEAELNLARITMDAMGLQVPDAGNGAASQDGQPLPVDQEAGDWEKFPADKSQATQSRAEIHDTPDTPSGSDQLSQSLNDALLPYRDDILAASEATGVPPNLLAAVIWDESKGIAGAGSTNGENGLTDTGLMQLNPDTFAALKEQHPQLLTGDASDPRNNIMAGALYLKQNHDQFGSWDLALRAYNSGPLSVDPADPGISTSGFGTRNYVEKVNFYMNQLDNGTAMSDGYPGGNQLY